MAKKREEDNNIKRGKLESGVQHVIHGRHGERLQQGGALVPFGVNC